jgi:hypothetical protein
MTKSEAEKAEELARKLEKQIRDRLLPEKGADFQITYFDGDEEIVYGERPHSWVKAESEGLRVVCHGPEFRVSISRQQKPLVPAFLRGKDGAYRRALRIAINGDPLGNNAEYYIHILGDLIVASREKIKCATMVNDESLTDEDQAIMDELRRKAKESHGD